MKSLPLIGIVLTFTFCLNLSLAKPYLGRTHLIDYKSFPDVSKNFERVGECVLTNHLSADTLTIELLSKNLICTAKDSFEYSYRNNTLSIITIRPYTHKADKIVFNPETNKKEIVHTVEMNFSLSLDPMHSKSKRQLFKFKGFKKCPTTISMDQRTYKKCPLHDIEYLLYKGDTINRINKDGYKEGVWLQFYETDELKERKYYDNGRFVDGKTYDKNGKDLHYIGEFSGGAASMRYDSLIFK